MLILIEYIKLDAKSFYLLMSLLSETVYAHKSRKSKQQEIFEKCIINNTSKWVKFSGSSMYITASARSSKTKYPTIKQPSMTVKKWTPLRQKHKATRHSYLIARHLVDCANKRNARRHQNARTNTFYSVFISIKCLLKALKNCEDLYEFNYIILERKKILCHPSI